MRRRTARTLMILGLLLVLAATSLGYDAYQWPRLQGEKMAAFQKMIGGVGLGAISTPLYNFINYDPRIQPVDDSITWPVPGVYSYGPDRTATVSYFEEIPHNELIRRQAPPGPTLGPDPGTKGNRSREGRK